MVRIIRNPSPPCPRCPHNGESGFDAEWRCEQCQRAGYADGVMLVGESKKDLRKGVPVPRLVAKAIMFKMMTTTAPEAQRLIASIMYQMGGRREE